MATIGELIISIKTDTASFASDLSRARNLSFDTASQIQRSFTVIGAAMAGMLTAAAAGVAGMTARAIDNSDQMGKMAERTGLTVEQFSSLAYAAKLSQVPVGELSQSLIFLSKNLEKSSEATQQGKAAHSALATLFKGSIPVFKSTDDAFMAISRRLEMLPAGYQKTALAAQLLGRYGGAALIPMMEGLAATRKEAEDLGLVISQKTYKSAEQFTEQITKMRAIFDALGVRLAEALLPYLTRLADVLLDVTKNAASTQAVIETLKASVQVLATVIVAFGGALVLASDELARFYFAAKLALSLTPGGFVDVDAVKQNLAEWKAATSNTVADFKSIKDIITDIWTAPLEKVKTATQVMADFSAQLMKMYPATPDAGQTDAELKAVQAVIDKLKEEVATWGLMPDAVERWKLENKHATDEALAQFDALIAKKNRLALGYGPFLTPSGATPAPQGIFDQMKQESVPTMPQLEFDPSWGNWDEWNKQMGAQAPQIREDSLPAFEKYQEAIAHLAMLQDQYGLTEEEVRRETEKLGLQFGVLSEKVHPLSPMIQQVRQDFSEMFTQAIFRASSFGDAMATLLERIAEVIFQTQVMDKLLGSATSSGGGFLGGILSGIGSFFGGGGGGGIDVAGFGVGGHFTGFAEGGSVAAGVPIMVGEQGPEVFTPDRSGAIIPNKALGGPVISITNNIDARGAAPGTEAAIARALKQSEDRTVARTVAVLDQRNARRA